MARSIRTDSGPPLWAILPFFYVAGGWLLVAGVLVASARPEALIAINEPRSLAAVHALGAGWVTTMTSMIQSAAHTRLEDAFPAVAVVVEMVIEPAWEPGMLGIAAKKKLGLGSGRVR